MSARPSVSVIIPTYNRAHCVGDAIDSVLSQAPPPDQVIVIDDGSTDDTMKVLASYGDRITIIEQANGGAGAARTAGLKQARGDWIAFLDSDDIWYPGRLSLLHRDLAASSGQNIVLHVADVVMTGEGYSQKLSDIQNWPVAPGEAGLCEDALAFALSGLHLNASAVHATAARNTSGFPTELKIEQDVYFLTSIALQGPALFLRSVVSEVRRISGDTGANVELNTSDPVRARHITQRRLELSAELPMSTEQKRMMLRHVYGHLLMVAYAEANAGVGNPRKHLLRMIKGHPNKVVGILKALPPFLLGRRGYGLLPIRKPTFSRLMVRKNPVDGVDTLS